MKDVLLGPLVAQLEAKPPPQKGAECASTEGQEADAHQYQMNEIGSRMTTPVGRSPGSESYRLQNMTQSWTFGSGLRLTRAVSVPLPLPMRFEKMTSKYGGPKDGAMKA